MIITINRKAKFEYEILEEFDAGIVLLGGEVKSIRNGGISLSDSFITIRGGELWIKNLKVPKYHFSHKFENHEPNREKKILLTKREILKIEKTLYNRGISCIPLSIFIKNNFIKIKIATVKGKKLWNKKQDIKNRDIERDMKKNL
jgi:SsrA-binding protein